MDLTLWETRLKEGNTNLKKVGRTVSLAQAQNELKQSPAAFVMLGTERAGANTLENAVNQSVAANVGIIIAVKNVGAKTGAKNIDQLKVVRDQIDALILGWQPADADDQVTFVSGRLLGFNNQVLWWMDFYQAIYTKRKV